MNDRGGRWLGLTAAYACVVAIAVALGLSMPLVPLAMERAGWSATLIGLNGTTGAVALLAVSPFIPWAAQRLGSIRFLALCFLVAAACVAAFPFTPIWSWFPLRFVLNASLQGLFVVSEIWINSLARESDRGRLIGLYGALATAGFAAGPAVARIFDPGSAWPFLLGAAVTLSALLPVLLARRQTPHVEHVPFARLGGLFWVAPAAILAAFAHAVPETALTSLLPIYAVRNGWTEGDALLLITAFGLGNVAMQVPIGWLADRIDRRALLLFCALGGAAGGLALPLAASTPWLLMALAFAWGGAIIGIYTLGLTLVGETFKGGGLAAASALFSLAYAAGSIAGPSGAGLAVDSAGGDALGWYVAAACAAYSCLLLAMRRRA